MLFPINVLPCEQHFLPFYLVLITHVLIVSLGCGTGGKIQIYLLLIPTLSAREPYFFEGLHGFCSAGV